MGEPPPEPSSSHRTPTRWRGVVPRGTRLDPSGPRAQCQTDRISWSGHLAPVMSRGRSETRVGWTARNDHTGGHGRVWPAGGGVGPRLGARSGLDFAPPRPLPSRRSQSPPRGPATRLVGPPRSAYGPDGLSLWGIRPNRGVEPVRHAALSDFGGTSATWPAPVLGTGAGSTRMGRTPREVAMEERGPAAGRTIRGSRRTRPIYRVVRWRDGYWWRVAVVDLPHAEGRVHLAADVDDEARALIVHRSGIPPGAFDIEVVRLRVPASVGQ